MSKKISLNEKEVVNDAVRLPKGDFISLYVTELGYEEQDASNAWHLIRSSNKGQALAKVLNVKVDPLKEEAETIKQKLKDESSKKEVSLKLKKDSEIKFIDRNKVETIGKVIKVLIGTDGREYVKIKLSDGKTSLKRTNAIIA